MGDLIYRPATEASEIIWQWNGVDVTQFGDGVGGPSAVQGGPANGSLSVDNMPNTLDTSESKRLKYTHTGGAALPLYLINDLPTLPDRYIVECTLGPRDLAGEGANTSPMLMPVYQDSAHWFSIGRSTTPLTTMRIFSQNNEAWATAGARRDLNTSQQNINEGTDLRILINRRDDDGVNDPGIKVWYDTSDFGQVIRVNQAGWTTWGTGVSVDSSWNGWLGNGTLKNVGLAFLETAGVAGYGFCSFLRIVSWRPV